MKEKIPLKTYICKPPLFFFLLPSPPQWPHWSCFSSLFILEQFDYHPSGISCNTLQTIGQLAGSCLRCSETTQKGIFSVCDSTFLFQMRNCEIFISLDLDKSKQEKPVINPTTSKLKNKNKLLQVIVFQLFSYCGCQNKEKKKSLWHSVQETRCKANKIGCFCSLGKHQCSPLFL